MLSENIISKVRALNLDLMTEQAVINIVEEAVAIAAPVSTALALQIPADWPADYQDRFWAKYPNKKSKARAMKSLDKIAFSGKVRWSNLIAAIDRYILSPKVVRGFVMEPATWLNGECWKDEEQSSPRPIERKSFFDEAADLLGGMNG